MAKNSTKSENVDKIRKAIQELDKDFFTRKDLANLTGMNYYQLDNYLAVLEEFREVEYSERMQIYRRL